MDKSLNKVILGSATLLAVGAAGNGNAQAATTNVPINAEILGAVNITQNQGMNFGVLNDTGGGGTATLGTGSTITGVSGGTTSAGGTITSGLFTVKATTGRAIDITTPASVTLKGTGGGATVADTMPVNSFSLLAPAGGGGASNTGTAATGAAIVATLTAATVTGFAIGGTITVGAGETAGTYAGQVTVTALYQ